jgi:hypothetical protein
MKTILNVRVPLNGQLTRFFFSSSTSGMKIAFV